MIYPRGDSQQPRPCLQWVTRGDYCYHHDPEIVSGRELRAKVDHPGRARRKMLLERKLALLPLLDLAIKARRGLESKREKLGATVVIDLIEQVIREEV